MLRFKHTLLSVCNSEGHMTARTVIQVVCGHMTSTSQASNTARDL